MTLVSEILVGACCSQMQIPPCYSKDCCLERRPIGTLISDEDVSSCFFLAFARNRRFMSRSSGKTLSVSSFVWADSSDGTSVSRALPEVTFLSTAVQRHFYGVRARLRATLLRDLDASQQFLGRTLHCFAEVVPYSFLHSFVLHFPHASPTVACCHRDGVF